MREHGGGVGAAAQVRECFSRKKRATVIMVARFFVMVW
jgi:hypothetical protein